MSISIKIRQRDLERFEMVRSLILEDITAHHTISYLSGKSAINEYKLKAGFKILYGESIYEFLQNQRMKRAIHLLNVTDDSIQEISARCGYGYATNFIAVFRKKFKIRPTDYRKGLAINRSLSPINNQPCFTDPTLLSIYPHAVEPFRKTV